MASNFPQITLARWLLKARKFNSKGFTLTELLVSIVMSTIIIGSLLYLVVELLGVNNREESLTQTQQDMNRALDYINRDVSESVFVYASPASIVGELDDLPTGATPVLAFWRLDPVDTSSLNCATIANDKKSECEALKVRHSVYTLVVYLQQPNSANDIWEGETRIIRYELPKYTASGLSTLTQRAGYADPSLPTNSFEDWTKGTGNTDGDVAVLTDYVDSPVDATTDGTCPDATNYTLAPQNFDNFYACVRTGDVPIAGSSQTSRTNQSVVLYLRGQALEDNAVVFGPTSQASRLPTLESEILIRGVIEKQPDSN